MLLFDLAGPARIGAGRGFSEGLDWAVGLVATEVGDRLLRRITTFRAAETLWRRSYEEHRLRLWPEPAVEETLRSCGFAVARRPDYDGLALPPSLHVYLGCKPC